jgi:hypothetical protein
MRRLLDGESDREAVLASFVTALPPDDEQVLRALLETAQATDGTDAKDGTDVTDGTDGAPGDTED